MNPGIAGLALQQRQEKERLRCKQGLPPQITPQVRSPIKRHLHVQAIKAAGHRFVWLVLCFLLQMG